MNIIKSDIIQLYGVANSMQGGRPENQDDMGFLDTPLGHLAIICDGMGGGPGGKTASYIVKHVFANVLCECSPQTPREYAFKMAASHANEALEKKMHEIPSLQGMGSTFVAVLLNKESAYIAHAGDSRCYLIRKGKCIYRSQDHSLVAELVKKKALTEEEARLSPQSNVISRGLGSITNHIPDIEEIPYKKGDRIVLCTDGVWGIMPHGELIKRLSQKTDIKNIVLNLSSEIDCIGNSYGGGHDNHTIAILELQIDSSLKEKIIWKRPSIFYPLIGIILIIFASTVVFTLKKMNNSNDVTSYDVAPSNNEPNESGSSSLLSAKNNEEEKNVKDTISNKVFFNNKDSILRQIDSIYKKGSKTPKQEKDSTSRAKKEQIHAKPSEITQKVINRYETAKKTGGTTVEDAIKQLENIKKEIKTLMAELQEQCKNSDVQPSVEAINRAVSYDRAWLVDKEKDRLTGKYKLTLKAQKEVDKQIERLTKLKKNF